MFEDVTLRQTVEFAITTEELGAKYYERFAKKFEDDEEIQQIFTQLAQDEVGHEKQFRKLLDKLPPEPTEHDEKYQVLKAWSLSEFFSRRRGLGRNLDDIKTRDDALQRAFDFEKDAFSFYQALRDVIGDEPVLQEIIDAERQHMLAVMKVLVSGSKFRGLADKGVKV